MNKACLIKTFVGEISPNCCCLRQHSVELIAVESFLVADMNQREWAFSRERIQALYSLLLKDLFPFIACVTF